MHAGAGRPHLSSAPSPAQTAHRRRRDPRRRCDRRCYEEILSLLRENVNESRDARACIHVRAPLFCRAADCAHGHAVCWATFLVASKRSQRWRDPSDDGVPFVPAMAEEMRSTGTGMHSI